MAKAAKEPVSLCSVEGCGRQVPEEGGAKGLCSRHYSQERRGKRPWEVQPRSAPGEGDQVNFRLPALDKAKVEAHAADLKQSPSELYRTIVQGWLERRERKAAK